ncbi:DUF3168 domain-containing protein [Bacillus sp. SCS-151]|uniref:DUF3168 domain-containing protein n=1 Tax=Nanhaiella sioensis TaxID=3115293 RepID=UPI003978B8DB
MTFEEALQEELSTIMKVYPLNAKEGTKAPYIIYVSSEGLQDKSLQGYLDSKEVSFELNILHNGYGLLKSKTRLVLQKVLSFQGRAIGNDGPFIENVSYEKPVELWEDQVKLYRCIINCKVKFKEG